VHYLHSATINKEKHNINNFMRVIGLCVLGERVGSWITQLPRLLDEGPMGEASG